MGEGTTHTTSAFSIFRLAVHIPITFIVAIQSGADHTNPEAFTRESEHTNSRTAHE
jgi:hypothetical protein